jgi:parallel beta-helix repeat protein
MRAIRVYLLTVLIYSILGVFALEAKVLYVDQTIGSDLRSYTNNSESTPWLTIGRAVWGSTNRSTPNAAEAALAGDTVIVKQGIYSVAATNERNLPSYNPINSGSNGLPITFRAVGVVDLRTSSGVGPIIGTYLKNYIIWDGFYISETTAPPRADTGPAVIWRSTGSQLLNLEIVGATSSWTGDNHNGIRLEYATNALIKNNKIHGIRNTTADENATAITLYDSIDTIIENNEMYDCYAGIYIKGGQTSEQTRTIVRYNLIYNMTDHGISVGPVSTHARIYQNIIRTSGFGIKEYAWATNHHGNIIANNTIEGCTNGFRQHGEGTDTIVQNNIISNVTAIVWSSNVSTPGTAVFKHNLYYNFTDIWYDQGGNHRNFVYWTGTWGKDVISPSSTSTTNPLFVDRVGHNYRLQSGSPALMLGIDILDLNGDGSTTDTVPVGAYITGNEVIGAGGLSTINPPRGLRIN